MHNNNHGETCKIKDEVKRKSVRLPGALAERLRRHAEHSNMSFNRAVIQCVEYALAHLDNPEDTDRQ